MKCQLEALCSQIDDLEDENEIYEYFKHIWPVIVSVKSKIKEAHANAQQIENRARDSMYS